MRIKEIDLVKGVGMLMVMLSHSHIEVPFDSLEAAPWSLWLNRALYSFFMPMFFVASGFFVRLEKPVSAVLKAKTLKLLVPYLCVTLIVMAAKMLLTGASDNLSQQARFLFLEGGNRWFVYALFWTFVVVMVFKPLLKSRLMRMIVAVALLVLSCVYAAEYPVVNQVMHLLPFLLIGMELRAQYPKYVVLMESKVYVAASIAAFLVLNVAMIPDYFDCMPVRYILMAFSGVNATWILCYYLSKIDAEKPVMRYLYHMGRYSLQFYLLLFPVAITAYIVGPLLGITNVGLITILMFVGQLIGITALVEITRRIPILKYPLGY